MMTINLREAVCFVRCEPIVAAPSMKTAAPDLTPPILSPCIYPLYYPFVLLQYPLNNRFVLIAP